MESDIQAFEEALVPGAPNSLSIQGLPVDVYFELTLQGYTPEFLDDFFS
jgi:hypothetical protein